MMAAMKSATASLSLAPRRPPALVSTSGRPAAAPPRPAAATAAPTPPPSASARRPLGACRAAAADADDLASAFAAELSARAATPPPAEASRELDGAMIGDLILAKYGLAFDVDLVARKWGPSTLVSVNVMWKHKAQASWRLTDEEYAARLEYIAMALRAWGRTDEFVQGLKATKEKPRVGKAAAVFLEGVPEERLREFVSF